MFDDHVCGISVVPVPKQRHVVQVSKTWHLPVCCGHFMGCCKHNFPYRIVKLLIILLQVSASMAAANSYGAVVAIRFLLGFVEAPFL